MMICVSINKKLLFSEYLNHGQVKHIAGVTLDHGKRREWQRERFVPAVAEVAEVLNWFLTTNPIAP